MKTESKLNSFEFDPLAFAEKKEKKNQNQII